MNAHAIQPDISDAIQQHVALLHDAAAGVDGVLVVSVFHASAASETDKPGTITHHRVGDVDGMFDAISAHVKTAGANIYVGLQVMRKGLARGHRGTESDIVAVLGLVADMDADTGKTGDYPYTPSFVLETSPGNRQPFWIFDKPVAPITAKRIAASLRQATGADFGTADVSHVWRVPGTLNWPNAKKLSRGRSETPVLVSLLEPWTGHLIDATDFAVTVGAVAGSEPVENKPVAIGDLPDVAGITVSGAAEDLLQADGQPDRSAHAARVIERLAFDGHTPEEALSLIHGCTGEWKDRYSSGARLEADFGRMWAKFDKKDITPPVDISKLIAGAKAKLSAANDNQPEVKHQGANNKPEEKPYQGIVSSSELVNGFIPPDYHIDGIIQSRYFYSLTGMTGTGKTAVLLLMAASTALNLAIGGREVRHGRVLYFAGENPDDVTMRWIAMAHQIGFNPHEIDVHFIKGTLNVGQMFERIKADVQMLGGVDMIVVDTSAAYFMGADENSNVEAGNHARGLRKLCGLPGGPVVLVACHPIKNASADNLLPRGGGAFIAEVDGNLTLAKAGGLVKMHWQGKHRGPDFEPINFQLDTVSAPSLVDSRGRSVPSVIAKALDDRETGTIKRQEFSDIDAVLLEIEHDGTQSIRDIAESLDWFKDGTPDRRRVQSATERMKRDKLVKYEANKWKITEVGREVVVDAKARRHAAQSAADFATRISGKLD